MGAPLDSRSSNERLAERRAARIVQVDYMARFAVPAGALSYLSAVLLTAVPTAAPAAAPTGPPTTAPATAPVAARCSTL